MINFYMNAKYYYYYYKNLLIKVHIVKYIKKNFEYES